jgi:hypothetical protein
MSIREASWKMPKVKVVLEEESSSVVSEIKYQKDISNGKFNMLVTFRTGALYRYIDVDAIDLSSILLSDSIGSAFNSVISKSGKYAFEKLM